MDAVVVVEWGEGIAEALSCRPPTHPLTRHDDDILRQRLVPHGSWTTRCVDW